MATLKERLLQENAEFSWGWGADWFLETNIGNFHWSDPDYNGDNSMKPFKGDYSEWCNHIGIEFARGKGIHSVERFCGDEFEMKE